MLGRHEPVYAGALWMPCFQDVQYGKVLEHGKSYMGFIQQAPKASVRVLVALLCSIWINAAGRQTPRGSCGTLHPTNNAYVLHGWKYTEGSGTYSTCPVSLVLEVRLARLGDKAEVRLS